MRTTHTSTARDFRAQGGSAGGGAVAAKEAADVEPVTGRTETEAAVTGVEPAGRPSLRAVACQPLADVAPGDSCMHPALCNYDVLRGYVARWKSCPIGNRWMQPEDSSGCAVLMVALVDPGRILWGDVNPGTVRGASMTQQAKTPIHRSRRGGFQHSNWSGIQMPH